jgi:hypothetical protein
MVGVRTGWETKPGNKVEEEGGRKFKG